MYMLVYALYQENFHKTCIVSFFY